jgi:hypothetical protein
VNDPAMFPQPIANISLFPSRWYPLIEAKDLPTAIASYKPKLIKDQFR